MTVSTADLLPANPEVLDGVDDLVELGYLNEPSVLHNLQYRYARDVIYVRISSTLKHLILYVLLSLLYFFWLRHGFAFTE